MIHQYALNGLYLQSFVQEITNSNGTAWGARDLAVDEVGRKLWGGMENNQLKEYSFNPNAGVHGALSFTASYSVPISAGTIRALARNPNNGHFFTKNFNGPLIEFSLNPLQEVAVHNLNGKGTYGLAWDTENSTMWQFDQDSPNGNGGDMVDFNEIGLTGLLTNRTFQGTTYGQLTATNIAGGCDIFNDGSGVLKIVALHQNTADELNVYELDPAPPPCSTTYTTYNDFGQGFTMNLYNPVMFGSGQLTLNPRPEPIPFVCVACSARNTVVRIDANTGAVLGEYYTRPAGMKGNPSRTTVDKYGNVWVSNRDEDGLSGGAPKGSVVRVGIVIGGTRGDKTGVGTIAPNPTGNYLRGPFIYSTAIDRDNDGLIKTSYGLGNSLAWTNAAGANTHGGVTTAEDECILNYTRIVGTNARTVAVDANNDLWTGGLGNRAHEKVSGVTGLPIAGTQFNHGCGGYGGFIDCQGRLWSAKGSCSTASTGVLVYDTVSTAWTNLGSTSMGNYGLGIDPQTGNVWCTSLGGPTCTSYASQIYKIDASPTAPTLLASYPYGSANAQGCAVDAIGNAWVAHSIVGSPAPSTVGRLSTTTGALIGNVTLAQGVFTGRGPSGIAIDTNGKVWVTCVNTSDVWRIDPNDTTAGPAGTVDLRIDLNANNTLPDASPYNYSDMTGFVLLGATAPSGFWTVVKDSLNDDTFWGHLSYTGSVMAGTGMKIEVRASNSVAALTSWPWWDVSNGGTFRACGRYLEIRVSMWRDPCSDPNATPTLYDLTVNCLPGDCPRTYCTPSTSTNGCNGSIDASGHPGILAGAPPGSDFQITVAYVEGQKSGLIFWGFTLSCGLKG